MFEHLSYITKTSAKVFVTLWIPVMLIVTLGALVHTLITGDWREYGNKEKAEKQ